MKRIDPSIPCPSCKGPLTPRVLGCGDCGLRVEGTFSAGNEFAALAPDLLHFLRIFVHCDGRIKDMERALGVSYPTVKATMTRLKQALQMPAAETAEAPASEAPPPEAPAPDAAPMQILAAIERGELTYTDGLAKLKAAKRRKGPPDA